jgi:large subunit ribosomal protein L18
MSDKKNRMKRLGRLQRQRRGRAKISGTPERPRLNVYRSLTNIYVQVIDDTKGLTLASASTIDKEVVAQVAGKNKTEAAKIVGRIAAERAQSAGVTQVVFDRAGYQYHGRVAAVAEGAREAGLQF